MSERVSSTSFTRDLVSETCSTEEGFVYFQEGVGSNLNLTFFHNQQSGQARWGWHPARQSLTPPLARVSRATVRRKPNTAPVRANTQGAHHVV